jgi:hypothetical protein
MLYFAEKFKYIFLFFHLSLLLVGFEISSWNFHVGIIKMEKLIDGEVLQRSCAKKTLLYVVVKCPYMVNNFITGN